MSTNSFYQVALATTAGTSDFQLLRLTTAGTGGTALTPNPMDPAFAVAGCTGMTLPSSKGTEGVPLWRGQVYFTQTHPTARDREPLVILDLDFDRLRIAPPVISAGTANGLCLKNVTGVAAATITWDAYVSELPY